jgi:hypothetical protein
MNLIGRYAIWHSGGIVICEELLAVKTVKVFGHLIVVGKSMGEDMRHLQLADWKHVLVLQ